MLIHKTNLNKLTKTEDFCSTTSGIQLRCCESLETSNKFMYLDIAKETAKQKRLVIFLFLSRYKMIPIK